MRISVDKIIPREHIPALERVSQNAKDKDLFLYAQALLLRSQGKTLKQIRDTLGVPESTVKFYTKRLKQEGVGGLKYRGQAGNRNLLSKEQQLKLKVFLSQSEFWESQQINWYILAEFGVKYAHSHSYVEVLERAGYVYESVWECYVTPEMQEQYKDVINELKALEREFTENPLDY